MATSHQLRKLATDPMAFARFQASGQLPAEPVSPRSPLIDLLLNIPPRELARFRGLRVGPELGYSGSRVFHTASQALLWLRPSVPCAHPPSESWRDKRFGCPLHLDDLLAHCAGAPEGVETRLERLLSPQAQASRRAQAAAELGPQPSNQSTPARGPCP